MKKFNLRIGFVLMIFTALVLGPVKSFADAAPMPVNNKAVEEALTKVANLLQIKDIDGVAAFLYSLRDKIDIARPVVARIDSTDAKIAEEIFKRADELSLHENKQEAQESKVVVAAEVIAICRLKENPEESTRSAPLAIMDGGGNISVPVTAIPGYNMPDPNVAIVSSNLAAKQQEDADSDTPLTFHRENRIIIPGTQRLSNY